MSEVVQFTPPGRGTGSGNGDGSGDMMLEARVSRLENDVAEIKADTKDVRDRLGRLEERLARMEGGFAALGAKIDARPTTFTLAAFLVTTSIATIGVIVAILSLLNAQ